MQCKIYETNFCAAFCHVCQTVSWVSFTHVGGRSTHRILFKEGGEDKDRKAHVRLFRPCFSHNKGGWKGRRLQHTKNTPSQLSDQEKQAIIPQLKSLPLRNRNQGNAIEKVK